MIVKLIQKPLSFWPGIFSYPASPSWRSIFCTSYHRTLTLSSWTALIIALRVQSETAKGIRKKQTCKQKQWKSNSEIHRLPCMWTASVLRSLLSCQGDWGVTVIPWGRSRAAGPADPVGEFCRFPEPALKWKEQETQDSRQRSGNLGPITSMHAHRKTQGGFTFKWKRVKRAEKKESIFISDIEQHNEEETNLIQLRTLAEALVTPSGRSESWPVQKSGLESIQTRVATNDYSIDYSDD